MIKTSIIGQALDVRVIYTVSVQVFFLLLTYRIVILTFSYTAYWLSTDIQYVCIQYPGFFHFVQHCLYKLLEKAAFVSFVTVKPKSTM